MATTRKVRTVTLHRVCWQCRDHGNRQEWFTTWNQAMRFARREKIADEAMFGTVEIPVGKRGLVGWLNTHFSTDNG